MARDGSLSATEPFKKAATVTPHDTNTFPACDALWVGDGNTNITVVMADGTTVTFNAVPDGTLLPIRCTAVKDTDTDADNIVRLNW